MKEIDSQRSIKLTNIQKLIYEGKVCPYCKGDSSYVNSKTIYGTYYIDYGMMYYCKDCNAYCGVHKGTDKSLGRLANKELREWKKAAHAHFDILWKEGIMTRWDAYDNLSKFLGIPRKYTHIGMFKISTCKKVVEWSKMELQKHKSFSI